MKTKKRLLSILLSLALVLGMMAGMTMTAYAATLNGTSYTWSEDSTIIDNVTIDGNVTVSNNLTLTIPAGKTLTVSGTITINNDVTLTVTGTGTLTVNGNTGNNAITTGYSGTLVVNGATVNATGGNGIGDRTAPDGIQATLIVNSGTVIATGGKGGDVDDEPIGGRGRYGISFEPTINGGTVIAIGGDGGQGNFHGRILEGEPGYGIWNPMYQLTLGTGVTLYGSDNAMPAGVGDTDKLTEGPGTVRFNNPCRYMKTTASPVTTYTVTYKVVGGTWSDDSTTNKTESVQSGAKPASVPTGMKANSGYTGGAWDTDPADATITEATTFTYTYTAIPTYEVTYKVVGGTWSDGSTTDKKESVQSGSKPASVPTGMKASSGYTGGAWDVNPAEATITGAKTFTYTFTANQAASVTKAPEARTLTFTGSAQELVTAGEASGGEMQYALGTATEATEPYTTSIPTATEAGTYYVWYKAVGDANHNDSEPKAVTVVIAEPKTYVVTVTNDGNGTGTAAPASGVEGTEVTLTATPATGYKFKEWQVVSGGVTITENKFKIGTENVEVKAIFEELPPDVYTVTVSNDGHGTGTATPASGVEGTEVTLTATPSTGYKFKEWQVVSGGVTITENKFKIGTANVEVKAVFEAQPAGSETGKAETKPGAPVLGATNMEEVVKSVVEAIKRGTLTGVKDEVKQALSQPGAIVTLTLVSTPLADNEIPAQDKNALDRVMQTSGYDGYAAFDLSLLLTVKVPGSDEPVTATIHNSGKEVTFTLNVPDNLKKVGRTFFLLHTANGTTNVVAFAQNPGPAVRVKHRFLHLRHRL